MFFVLSNVTDGYKIWQLQKQDPLENEKLCAFLVEKALSKLPVGTDNILGIFDLRGFCVENGDLQLLKFLVSSVFS
jgi:hypothetical protein